MKECPECFRCFEDRRNLCPEDGTALHMALPGSCVLDHKYRLLKGLGRGGMGTVYEARHLGLDRPAAVKILRPRLREVRRFEERFRQEARLLARLRHRHVVEVHDFGVDTERGLAYLVMEYLEGISLAELTRGSGPLAMARVLEFAEQIAAALDEAHRSGIVHCDLKPSNVVLLRSSRLKVIDFGVARLFAGPARATPGGHDSGFQGTPAYMAPELFERAEASAASDVYALGVLLYELLTGQRPFEGSHAELASSHMAEPPRPPSELVEAFDTDLDDALLAVLAKLPAARPATASAVVEGVRRPWGRLEHRRQFPRRLAAAVLLALLATFVAMGSEAPLARLENRLADARVFLSPPRPPRHPITLVLIDDSSLREDPTPLAGKGDEAGELLAGVLRAGAAGVAVDMLLPAAWSRSEAFAELVLSYPDRLRLAAYSTPAGEVVGPEVLGPLTTAVLGPARAAESFGYVNVEPDGDGVIRRLQPFYHDVEGRLSPSFARRAAGLLCDPAAFGHRSEAPYLVDFTRDWRELARISWKDLGAVLEREPERFRGHLVLVGGTYAGSGDEANPVPHPAALPEAVPGVVLQALAVHTLADGRPVRAASRLGGLLLTFSMAAAGAAAVMLTRCRVRRLVVALALVPAWLLVAGGLFVQNLFLVPAVTPIVAALVPACFGLFLAARETWREKRTGGPTS